MMLNRSECGVQYIDPLFRLCNVLAILPPCECVLKCNKTKIRFYRCYAVLVAIITLIGSGLAITGRYKDLYVLAAPTTVITDIALALGVTVANAVIVLVPSIFHMGAIRSFLELSSKIDSRLFKGLANVPKSRKFYAKLVSGHLTLIAVLAYDAYVWTEIYGFVVYRHFIFRNFQYYQIYITVNTMCNLMSAIQFRFETLNDRIRQLAGMSTTKDCGTKLSLEIYESNRNEMMREVSEIYEMLVGQIGLFNKIFGWQMLFMSLGAMLGLLNSLDMLTICAFDYQKNVENKLNYHLIALSCVWAGWQLILATFGSISCTKTSKEAQATVDVCFSVLMKLPRDSPNSHEKGFREEIVLLKEMAVYVCPTFTAAGFFNIDYPLLLSIFGSVTSYLIVLIQFNK